MCLIVGVPFLTDPPFGQQMKAVEAISISAQVNSNIPILSVA